VTTFDLHQHLWPEPLISALSARTRPPRLRGTTLETSEGTWAVELDDHDPQARIALLDRDGIDTAVLSLPPTLEIEDEELLGAYDSGIREVVAASSGRFAALAAGETLEGFAGATVAGRRLVEGLNDLGPLLDGLRRHGRFLFVHPGPGRPTPGRAAWWAPIVEYTAEMQAAYAAWIAEGASRYPDLRVVFAILAGGAPIQLERLRSRGVEVPSSLHANVFFDVSSYGRRALELCLATVGADRLVYGSDMPVIDSKGTLEGLAALGDEVRDAVCSENPGRLLGQDDHLR
jgi:predicted TIM-barrel fold metal-dependent hydrolase